MTQISTEYMHYSLGHNELMSLSIMLQLFSCVNSVRLIVA